MVTLVFLHGISGSKQNFKYLEKELSDFPTLSFDLIGYGDEEKPRTTYTSETFVAFLEKKLNLDEKYVLIGHSLGAIIAKDFAIKHPKNIEKVFLIAYPSKAKESIENTTILHLKHPFIAALVCKTEVFWKYLLYPYAYLKYKPYFDSFRYYFKHTHHSQSQAIKNTLLKEDINTLKKIKNKAVFINGSYDEYIKHELKLPGKSYLIPGMGHQFFTYEARIADIIRKELLHL